MKSVLQDWVMELPLREQGTLVTGVRGCDVVPKYPLDSPERQLTAFMRWCFMNPADPREVDIPGAFFRSTPPDDFKPSMLGHYPLHWVSHVMHVLEVIGYRHPDWQVALQAHDLYTVIVRSLHLTPEPMGAMYNRLSEDRIATDSVVS